MGVNPTRTLVVPSWDGREPHPHAGGVAQTTRMGVNALSSLQKMYNLLYTLIMITLLAGLIALGLQLYLRYSCS
jgi:hypothetical protein